MVTCGTYLKQHFFQEPQRQQQLHDLLLSLAASYAWKLEAWSVFSNHYHFVGQSPDDPSTLELFLGSLHEQTAKLVNHLDDMPGRKVWHNYWDSHITYQRSYLARLQYVHNNAVHHRLVLVATAYPWCSAAWLERTASTAFQRTLASIKTDRISVMDEF